MKGGEYFKARHLSRLRPSYHFRRPMPRPDFLADSDKTGSNVVLTISVGSNVVLTISVGLVICKSMPDFLVDSYKTGSNVVLTISV